MSSFARFRFLVVIVVTLAAAVPLLAAADRSVSSLPSGTSSYILIGFAGGFVRHDNPLHGPVHLAQKIQPELPSGSSIQIFENRHRKAAYKTILRLLDRNHDGVLSDLEKAQARIILFGHSWGASAAVSLSRDLARVGIPVLLTVQVDSVAKPWQDDKVIPDNVAEAVNFYQPHGPGSRARSHHRRRRFQDADSGQLPLRLPSDPRPVSRADPGSSGPLPAIICRANAIPACGHRSKD